MQIAFCHRRSSANCRRVENEMLVKATDVELGVRIMRPALTFISTSIKMGKKNCLGSDFKLTIREIGCMCIEASHM